jgi:hypothetical protein
MRKMLLLLSLGLLGVSMALAQDTSSTSPATAPNASATDSSASAGPIQGCLSGSDGNYMLTQDGTGTTFKLMGDEIKLKKHIGHEVAVTGQATADGGSSAADPNQGQGDASASATTGAGTTIQVTEVKMVAKQCMGSGASQSR